MPSDNEQIKQILEQAELETLAIRAGTNRSHEGEHAEALWLTSSYVFENCADAAAKFSGDAEGNVYSRYTNPTVRSFELRLAAMEQAEDCVATSSGMAAIMSCCMAHLKAGDHMICSRDVFGSTTVLLNNFFSKFDIEISFVGLTDTLGWKNAIKPNTRLLFLESPSNPMNEVADLSAIAELAHSNDALLIVDNCFCTPALQQPLKFGADLVVHSATKFIDGQGRCLGGAVLGSKELVDPVLAFLRSGGPSMSPFNAWVFLKGLETLNLRMREHSASALHIAGWLKQQAWVEKVFYCGLEEHSGHDLASRQQSAFGGVLSFRISCKDSDQKGGAWRFIDATRLMSLTANLGDAKTTIVHPATTTHGRITQEQRDEAGITDNLVRIAVGLESVEDIKKDLLRGAAAI